MIKTLIVDDEPLARKRIKKLLQSKENINNRGEAGNVEQAVLMIDDLRPDIVFLDIRMKSKTGFEVIDRISHLPIVIFITAYDKYAIKAFEYAAFDYLVKPFKEERFYLTLERAMNRIKNDAIKTDQEKINELISFLSKQAPIGNDTIQSSLPIKMADRTYFVSCLKIEYIKASGYYAELIEGGKKHILREPLTELIRRLDNSRFVRIHRSTIINREFLSEVVSIGFGDVEVKMKDGSVHRVSKSFKEDLLKLLGML